MPSVALNLVLNEGRIFSGDVLNATVLLDSGDPDTVIHEFGAEVNGMGRTGWINIHTDKIYETEQEYLSAFLPLCSANQSGMALKPGRHQFSMRVLIPETAPSSYESQFGSIRYTIKIKLLTNSENVWGALHMGRQEHPHLQEPASLLVLGHRGLPFYRYLPIVVARTSFDEIPQAIMQPIDYRDETDFTVCTLPFGTVFVVISLERTGFCIGEEIPVGAWIKNRRGHGLQDCRLQFLLKTQFEAKSRYEHAHDRKLLEQVMDSWPLGKVKGRTEAHSWWAVKRFKDCRLRVADGVVPTQQSSGTGLEPNIITISYVLRFNAEPGVETEIPLIITSEGYRKQASNNRVRSVEKKEQEVRNCTYDDGGYKPPSLDCNSAGARSADPTKLATRQTNNLKQQKRVSIFEGSNGRHHTHYC